MIRRRVSILFFLALSLAPFGAGSAWAQFNSVLKSPGAAEQLRLGVQSYQRGRYGESILLFEKLLPMIRARRSSSIGSGVHTSRAATRKRPSGFGNP